MYIYNKDVKFNKLLPNRLNVNNIYSRSLAPFVHLEIISILLLSFLLGKTEVTSYQVLVNTTRIISQQQQQQWQQTIKSKLKSLGIRLRG